MCLLSQEEGPSKVEFKKAEVWWQENLRHGTEKKSKSEVFSPTHSTFVEKVDDNWQILSFVYYNPLLVEKYTFLIVSIFQNVTWNPMQQFL